jgi:hypothetical protein
MGVHIDHTDEDRVETAGRCASPSTALWRASPTTLTTRALLGA